MDSALRRFERFGIKSEAKLEICVFANELPKSQIELGNTLRRSDINVENPKEIFLLFFYNDGTPDVCHRSPRLVSDAFLKYAKCGNPFHQQGADRG